PSDTPQLRQYTRRARIAQSLVLPPVADEPVSPLGDDSQVPTGSGSIPTATGVPTGSDVVPTASPIFTIATESTPYTRRKGKEKMIDVQVARELEEEMARDAQRMNEQIARDAEIAKIHAEEELQMMIDGLYMNNETVAKYL
nr:hypothetical protein [Tanacetum cinerariifolium]